MKREDFSHGYKLYEMIFQRSCEKMKRKAGIILMVAMALVLVTAVAYAITITIDGVREVAWDGGGSVTDPNEAGVTNDGFDVDVIEWTNDTSNFYILLSTYAATGWNTNNGPDFPYVYFCMNTDGLASGTANICVNGAGGYDRYIRIAGPTPLTVTVFDQNFNTIAATTDVATVGSITEISIDVTSLGLSTGVCGAMPSSAYFDGRTGDPDDNVQDAGDFNMNCGNPTAVSLHNATASGPSAVLPFALGAFGLIAVSTGLVISRKRKNA
ncbi:MAG: hypothetical protein H6667_05990 [Ardenticatenaceae bacterium]|nr:hypothetical protein [Ardenticatenaceae bacterium]MCB9443742.1 hypothetical protein [Ardenticatenaceae bacterium]